MTTDPISAALRAAVAAELAPLAEQLEELRQRVAAPVAPPALVDRKGLARELATSLATIDRLRAEGLPELRLVDSPRFDVAAVIEWLRQRGQR